MSPEKFSRSIKLYRERYSSCFYSRDCPQRVSGDIFLNITVNPTEIVTLAVCLDRNVGKANLNVTVDSSQRAHGMCFCGTLYM